MTSYREWKGWRAQDFGACSPRDAAIFAGELARAGVGSGSGPVLELGYGNGAFLAWARDAGFACDGVELDPALLALARDAGFTVFGGLEDVPRTPRYALIAAFDVVEHVPDAELPALFEGLAARLAPHGRLLIRSPNGDSPLGRHYQHGDVTHRSAIGSHKVRQLASMSRLTFGYSEAPFVPYGDEWSARGLKARMLGLARRTFERLIAGLYFGGEYVCLAPNLVSLCTKPAD